MYSAMFEPLFNILGRPASHTSLSNALDRSSVISALMAGIIWFNDNKFYGTFNAAIGRELRSYGANFNSLDKTYFIKISDLPMNIRASISESSSKFKAQQDALRDALNKMNTAPQIHYKEIVGRLDSMFIDLHKQFSTSIPKNLAVPMDVTPRMRETIAEDYTYNMNKYIQDWYADDIIKLRGRVEEAVAVGYRADHMRDVLMAEYGVAERKALFLAKQEGSLLVSKYRETRYKEVGLMRYRWSTSHDQRVRHDHRELNEKIFDWDHPPITDQHTDARNHPGEDFNCRCVAIPIVE
jgi:SPP1 gp7 family putative phage head morphogenesis protein